MDKRPNGAGSLDTFWRSAENFRTEASDGMLWAVSQAAPLRRVHVAGDLVLHDKGAYASGGLSGGCFRVVKERRSVYAAHCDDGCCFRVVKERRSVCGTMRHTVTTVASEW